ncbi:MAG: hypothetical protein P4L46_19880 [Fimbriimonas sp.]|nr:hypothetical protein [Fimbriimonas sp.]
MKEVTPEEDAKIQQSFRVCREEVKHEYGVLANRLNSYITSQAFLVSGYAVSMANTNPVWGSAFRLVYPLILCILGMILSIRAKPGISGVCRVIQQWHAKQSELFRSGASLDDYSVLRHDSVKKIHDNNLIFAQSSTYIFGGAWILMGLLSIYLHFA